jgi:hypothetical protein
MGKTRSLVSPLARRTQQLAGFRSGVNTDGGFNSAVGAGALLSSTSASRNRAIGAAALLSNTTGSANTADGALALFSNTEGAFNTAVGDRALLTHTTGHYNTAIGASALFSDTTGTNNTATGAAALFGNTIGAFNTAMGDSALALNTIGESNTAVGFEALFRNTTGNGNTAAGYGALISNTTGHSNTALGSAAGINVTTAIGIICIGAVGQNVSNSCYIGQIFGQPSGDGAPVFVNAANKLGTIISSKRFKQDIMPLGETSEALLALKPVAFRYKQDIDPDRRGQFGLVAEDVEAVNPDLVVRDKEGKPHSVRYEQVNAMLLNEFLKEHRKNEEQQATIAELKKAIARLTARDEEQAAQIQKVSAQIEVSKPAPQVVNNP